MGEFGRDPKTKAEKEFAALAYTEGMKNGWCSGRYARLDGDFITEEDCLNKNSICVIEDAQRLKEFFIAGNWCLGQGVIHKSLCFITQIDGGDEWLTMKRFKDKVYSFESITFRPMCHNYKSPEGSGEHFEMSYGAKEESRIGNCFERYLARLLKARLVDGKVKY
jgi:hypothetical protein